MKLYRNVLYSLYIMGFLSYGLKFLLGTPKTFSNFLSLTPFFLIILLRFISLVGTGWKRPYRLVPLTGVLGLVMLHFFLSFSARFKSDFLGIPGSTYLFGISSFAVYFLPFLATLIVLGYSNKYNWSKGNDLRIIFIALSGLLLINFMGYAAGIQNSIHHLEGRINLPLMPGIYSGSNLAAMVFLMCYGYLRFNTHLLSRRAATLTQTLGKLLVITMLGISAYLIIGSNSRLTILMLLFVLVLSLNPKLLVNKTIFFASFLTLPILLNFGYLLYYLLSMPFFESLLLRVDFEDIITFHGRSYIWERLFTWMFEDRTNLLLGNGYRGQYFLKLIDDIGEIWYGDTFAGTLLHMHSSFGELIIGQGFLGFIVYFLLLRKTHRLLLSKFHTDANYKILSLLFIFLLFLFQIDEFVYFDNLGGIILAYFFPLLLFQKAPSTDEGIASQNLVAPANSSSTEELTIHKQNLASTISTKTVSYELPDSGSTSRV